jgi:hypothetical protein
LIGQQFGAKRSGQAVAQFQNAHIVEYAQH